VLVSAMNKSTLLSIAIWVAVEQSISVTLPAAPYSLAIFLSSW